MVLDTTLFNIQHYKVQIKAKVEQSREKVLRSPLHLGVVANEKGAFGSHLTTVTNFAYLPNPSATSKVVTLSQFWSRV